MTILVETSGNGQAVFITQTILFEADRKVALHISELPALIRQLQNIADATEIHVDPQPYYDEGN